MSQSLDAYLPKTQFQLPGGDCLVIATMWDQDSCRQLVLLQVFSAGSQTPRWEFAVSAKSADAIIAALQESANQARFISGECMYVYPPPIPDTSAARSPKKKCKPRKK